jgi:hypothetical protein
MSNIQSKKTVSGAFDNWQYGVNKNYQSSGKSSIFQKATAMFLKLDKAFEVPVGSVMRTSNGINFRVTNCIKIDNYAYQITGDVIDIDGLQLNDDMRQDVEDIRSGHIVWPTVGIDVTELRGANPCGDITYIDQHIPPPIRARVPSEVTADDLLFGRRDFCCPEDESS